MQALNRLLPYHVDDLGDIISSLKGHLGDAREALPHLLAWV